MKNRLVAERYANGLSAAVPDEDIEAVLDGLDRFAALYAEHPFLRRTIENPAIVPVRRLAALDGVLASMELPRIVTGFIRTLFQRRRLNVLEYVVDLFSRIADTRLGRATARITTAAELGPAEIERLRQSLGKYSGKSVRIRVKVDPEIIGGVVARLDGRVIDGSIRSRLERLRQAVLAQGEN